MKYIKKYESKEEKEALSTVNLAKYLEYLSKKRHETINIDIVKKLIEDGADVNVHDKVNNYGSLLCMAATIGSLETVKLLVKKHARLNDTNSIGATAMYAAAHTGYFDIVKYLVEKGADFDIPNDSKVSPLASAAFTKHIDIAIYLLKKGAKVDNFFNINSKNTDYNFQKEFIKLYPTEFINNVKDNFINNKIKKEFAHLFNAHKYNL